MVASCPPTFYFARSSMTSLLLILIRIYRVRGHLEADLAALYGQVGHKYPRRGRRDQAAAGGGKQ